MELIGNGWFSIKRADGTHDEQDIGHMFGELTKKRSFRKGDHALALAMPSKFNCTLCSCSLIRLATSVVYFTCFSLFIFVLEQGICMPAIIKDRVNDNFLVEFCDGQM